MTIETHSKKFFERKLPELFEIFDDLSLEARVVGGFVRDYFSIENKFSRDLDIEIDFKNDNDFQKNWNSLSSKILNHKTFKKKVKKLEFNILKISYGEFDIELSPIRIESFNDSNQHTNFKARYFSTLDFNKSYLRRDLTINSMGLAYFQGEFRFLDPAGGLEDLKQRKIKYCDLKTFYNDPVRVLRAIRFQVKLGFDLSDELKQGLLALRDISFSHYYLKLESEKSNNVYEFIMELFKYNCIKLELNKMGINSINENFKGRFSFEEHMALSANLSEDVFLKSFHYSKKKFNYFTHLLFNLTQLERRSRISFKQFRESLDYFKQNKDKAFIINGLRQSTSHLVCAFRSFKPNIDYSKLSINERKDMPVKVFSETIKYIYNGYCLTSKDVEEIKAIFFESSSKKEFSSKDEKEYFLHKYLLYFFNEYPESCFYYKRDGKILGYIICCPNLLKDQFLIGEFDYLANAQDSFKEYPAQLHINCHFDSRGKGIGSILLWVLEARLKSQGIGGVHLFTLQGDKNVKFYNKNGYKKNNQSNTSILQLLKQV